MKKVGLLLAVIMLTAALFAGCGIKEADIPYADGMAENILQGIKANDYAMFSRDFGEKLKAAINEDAFSGMVAQFADTIGTYESKAFAQAANTTEDDVEYTVVVYKAKFTKEDSDVLVTVTFGGEDDSRTVEGLFFTSPTLRGE
jgi:hypothetical protein